MRDVLLSIASPDSLSWTGFAALIAAMCGEVAVWLIPEHSNWHKHAAFGFAVLAVAGYATERVGDDAITDALKLRTTQSEQQLGALKAKTDKLENDTKFLFGIGAAAAGAL